MMTLFPVAPVFPDGFVYVPDFLDNEDERYFLKQIDQIPLHTFVFQGYEAKRKVASFGYDYSYEKRGLSEGEPIPPAFDRLIKQVSRYLMIDESDFAELLITKYPAGSVINWHRDANPFELIAGISLLSDCIFRLRPHEKSRQGKGSVVSVPVSRRSLYVMRGEARMHWQHSISPVKETRYSITLRTLRKHVRL